MRAALAAAAVDREHGDFGEVRGVDAEHVRAVRGEGAAANRPRDDPGEVRHPHPGKRPFARGQRARSGVANPHDLDHGNRGEGRGLRVGGPFGAGAQRVARQPARREGVLELEGVPAGERACDLRLVVPAAELAEDPVAVVRVPHVELHPPTRGVAEVRARPIRSRDLRRVDAQVVLAPVGDGGVAHRDPDRLRRPGAEPPQLARGEPRGPDAGARRDADREHRGKGRLRAGELDPLERPPVAAREGPDPLQRRPRRPRLPLSVRFSHAAASLNRARAKS